MYIVRCANVHSFEERTVSGKFALAGPDPPNEIVRYVAREPPREQDDPPEPIAGTWYTARLYQHSNALCNLRNVTSRGRNTTTQ